jgi:HlyD family secretion protein
MFGNLINYFKKHKGISTIIVIIILIGGYFTYRAKANASSETRYVLSAVERGTLISTVTGTGQVVAGNQVDIKPKVSGDITYVGVTAGQSVKAGTIIAKIDSRDALQAVRDAEVSLASAKISLQSTKTSSVQSRGKASDDVTKAYDTGYNTIASTFVDFATVIDDAGGMLNDYRKSPYLENEEVRRILGNDGVTQKGELATEFEKSKTNYNQIHEAYKQLNRQSDPKAIEVLLGQTYVMSKQLADSVKSIRTFVGRMETAAYTVPTQLTTDKATLDKDIGTINGRVVDLFAAQTSIQSAKDALQEANQSYTVPGIGSGSLDVQNAQLTVVQKQNAYQKTLDTLSDYTIRAPFDGIIASVSAEKGISASSGASLATIITPQQIATVSMNEIDAAKIKVGQKVNLTFDALPDLTLTGKIIEIDTIGTVSQGVVSYNAKIGFDTQDDRVKPGMSVSASIITAVKPNVLLVPTSAIKTSGNTTNVQTLDGGTQSASTQTGVTSVTPPRSIQVEIGDANDTETEIVSGLKEGDQIITRTISASAATTQATQSRSLLNPTGGAGANRTGGNAVRFQR